MTMAHTCVWCICSGNVTAENMVSQEGWWRIPARVEGESPTYMQCRVVAACAKTYVCGAVTSHCRCGHGPNRPEHQEQLSISVRHWVRRPSVFPVCGWLFHEFRQV